MQRLLRQRDRLPWLLNVLGRSLSTHSSIDGVQHAQQFVSLAAITGTSPSVTTSSGACLQLTRSYASQSTPQDFDLISSDPGLANIDSYDATGFTVNGIAVEGSVLCAGDVFTLWKVQSLEEFVPDSLAILLLLKPAVDLLVFGCGAKLRPVPAEMRDFLRSHDISIEVLDTANAVATFSLLNQEARAVAGAFLPLDAT